MKTIDSKEIIWLMDLMRKETMKTLSMINRIDDKTRKTEKAKNFALKATLILVIPFVCIQCKYNESQ